MKREKVIQIFSELKKLCPGLLLAGSALDSKKEQISDLDLIWVGKIFPMHLLPVGEMKSGSVNVFRKNILRFKYKGEQVDIHRTDKDNLTALKAHLSGAKK